VIAKEQASIRADDVPKSDQDRGEEDEDGNEVGSPNERHRPLLHHPDRNDIERFDRRPA
jgi:hypothetical protein